MASATGACWTGWVRVADPGATFDLGIDTASDDASLAVFRAGDDEPMAVRRFRPETTMSRELLGELSAFLAAAGVDRTAIGRIAVTTGPGQYGPLRSGIAVAQGMAMALDAPLAGVGRFEADAMLVDAEGQTVIAVHETRSGPAWAAFETSGDVPREVVPASVTSYAEAAAQAPRPAVWTGEVGPEHEALTAAQDAEGRTGDTIAAEPRTPRAVAIVRIARVRGTFGDPAGVDAIYLRPPSITRPRAQ